MNKNDIIFYDYETGSRNPNKTQAIQLAAVAINGRSLSIIHGSEFNSLIKPLSDEEAIKRGLDPLQDEALEVNGKTREELENAPSEKIVWKQFTDYVNKYNYQKNTWGAPICAGYNNNGFDDIITQRLCIAHGPIDDTYGKQKLFHPIHNIDLMKLMWYWTENNPDIHSLSMDSLRKWLGLSTEGAHDGLIDVKQGGAILIKMLKLSRKYATKVKFQDAFKGTGI
jgi:exonuclease I